MIAPEDLVHLPRDSKREKELSGALRVLTDEKKWEYIRLALDADQTSLHPIGLVLAQKISLKKQYLIEILELSLERGDPSSMQAYLNAVLAGLGYSRVVRFFVNRIENNPEQVGMALYFLPNMSLAANESERAQILVLKNRFCEYLRLLDDKSSYLQVCLEYHEKST